MSSVRQFRNAMFALAALSTMSSAQAGLLSNTAVVTINATKVATLTVAITAGATQTLASLTDNTTNNFASPVAITTTWDVNPSAAAVVLVGYFTTPTQALANGTDFITASQVRGRMNASPTFNAFTGGVVTGGASTAGVAGGTLQLFSQAITGLNKNSNRSDNLFLQIDLTAATATVGTYTGTLNLRAITQ